MYISKRGVYGIILKGPDYYLSFEELKAILETYKWNNHLIYWKDKLALLNYFDENKFSPLGFSKYLFKVELIEKPEKFKIEKPINPKIIDNGANYKVFDKINFNSKGERWIIVKERNIAIAGPIIKVNRKETNRWPQNKPCVHPSSLVPTLAKVLINLSRVKEGETLYDPFCGVGGILIEAGLMGINVLGSDINKNFIECAKRNLEYYGIKNYKLKVCDARELCFDNFDVIVADPPYGRYSKVYGEIKSLYKGFLEKARDKLRKGYVSMFRPEFLNPEEFVPEEYKILLDRIWVAPGIKRYFLLLRIYK